MSLKKLALKAVACVALMAVCASCGGAGEPAAQPPPAEQPPQAVPAEPATAPEQEKPIEPDSQSESEAPGETTPIGNSFTLDLNEALTNVSMAMEAPGLNFYNTDFTELDIKNPDTSFLVRLAEKYVEADYTTEPGTVRINAGELQTFMKEAFNIELPLETFGEYNYADGVFSYYDGGKGYAPRVFKPESFMLNADGSVTAEIAYYTLGMVSNDYYEEAVNSPVEEWGKEIVYGINAGMTIVFKQNKDFTFFPIQLIKTESVLYSWADAEGTYVRKDGAAELIIAVEGFHPERVVTLNMKAIDSSGAKYETSGYADSNCADFTLEKDGDFYPVLVTLKGGGALSATSSGLPGFDFAGEYTRK